MCLVSAVDIETDTLLFRPMMRCKAGSCPCGTAHLCLSYAMSGADILTLERQRCSSYVVTDDSVGLATLMFQCQERNLYRSNTLLHMDNTVTQC